METIPHQTAHCSLAPDVAVVDVDEVIERMELGFFHWRMLLICGLAFMAEAMEISLLSFIAICAGDEWNLSGGEVATITSCVFVGMLVGNFFWGPFADVYGRRGAFLLGSGIIVVFGVGTGFSPNFATLVVMRALLGFGVGGCTVSFDILAEFLPRKVRGAFLTNINYFWTIGSMIVAGAAWAMLSEYGWHLLAVVTALPVCVALIWAMFVLPESPRWLVLQGRHKEAKEVLLQCARINGSVLPPFELAIADVDHYGVDDNGDEDRVRASKRRAGWSDFCSPQMARITIPLWIIWFLFGLTYYGIILLTARVYQKGTDDDGDDGDEFVCDFSYQDIFLSAASEVAGIALTAVVIDRWGRLGSQTSLYGFAGVGVILMGMHQLLGMSDAVFTLWALLARISSMAATSVTMVVTPELFNTKTRASGHSIGSIFSRFGGFATPYLVNSKQSVLFVSVVLGAGNLLAMACSFMLPETKDSDLDHIRDTPFRVLSDDTRWKEEHISTLSSEHDCASEPLLS